MDLGRASLPKYLVFAVIGGIAGLIGVSMARGTGAQSWILLACALLGLCFMGYVIWLLAFKNTSTRTATPAQKAAALQFTATPGNGVIYIYRKQLVGLLVGLDVVLDGNRVGQTRGLRFYRLQVPPGTHVLSGDGKCPQSLSVDVADGEIAYVEQEIVMGMIKGSYRYNRITQVPQAQQAIYSCKLLLPTG